MKIVKYIIIGLIALGLISLFLGEEEETVSTGNNAQETSSKPEKEATSNSKVIDVSSQSQTLNGLVINLGEMKIEEDSIQIGMNIENTSNQTITFYPDQGNAVIGNMQIEANMFLGEGDVSGDIMSGVQKEGVIEFLTPEGKKIDLETLKEIKFHFGNVNDESYMNTKEANFVIPVQ